MHSRSDPTGIDKVVLSDVRHILLTGGTGFFGRSLLRYWVATSSQRAITVLTRNPEFFLTQHPEFGHYPNLRFLAGDVLRPESLPHDQKFDAILHAATESTSGHLLSPLQRYTQIVDGTRNLLDLAIESKAKRFLLTSSGAVYGPQPTETDKLPESYSGTPDTTSLHSAYGLGKRAAEYLCTLYGAAHALPVVIARCFAFVGPDLPMDAHFAIGNFIRDALINPEITVSGDGSAVRSYLDQRDLAQWLTTLLERGANGGIFNVGSDQAISIRDLAHQVRDLLCPGKYVRIEGATGSGTARNRYVPDISRAKAEFGLDVHYSLQDAILNAATIFAPRLQSGPSNDGSGQQPDSLSA